VPDLLPEIAPGIRPATRQETLTVGLGAVVAGFFALALSAKSGDMMLYGDAVAHLAKARGLVDTNTPGLGQLGGVWLPLPHLLMLPFVGRMDWWQNGMAGAWPSLICFIISVMGLYRLARRLLEPGGALVAAAFFGLNANLLYLSTTAMTEPLFLALLVWIVLLTMEFADAVKAGAARAVTGRMLWLGGLILAATMTRYDGWILGAAVWCFVAWQLWKSPAVGRQVGSGFAAFTILCLAGPIFWFWYNHRFEGDWLDFMRGPHSAKEIDRRTSPPGARKYWGWHNPAWSLMLYARTAQVDAAAWETGWLVAAAALWASWKAWRSGLNRAWLLLWLPLPFYVYSISYGSVPIFIPQLYPHSYYNSRYGMEMLPVLAVFLAYGIASLVARFGSARPLVERLAQPMTLMLCVLNLIWMLHATPLVLKEAMVNSRSRLAIEEPLARQLAAFTPGATILMDNSDHVGALQEAGIPLKQTIGPSDYYRWRAGMADPAGAAAYVISIGDDAVAAAVKAHPDGLTELMILCSSNQPCVRIYQSARPKT
jgi:hypothetical protein